MKSEHQKQFDKKKRFKIKVIDGDFYTQKIRTQKKFYNSIYDVDFNKSKRGRKSDQLRPPDRVPPKLDQMDDFPP